MADPKPAPAEKSGAAKPVTLVANHMVYHTAGVRPALAGEEFTVAEEHVAALRARGAARTPGDPPPFGRAAVQQGVTGPLPPTVMREGAETLAIPGPTRSLQPATPAETEGGHS